MTDRVPVTLKNVQQTLLLPLWGRAVETTRTNPLLVDIAAARIIAGIDYDFSTISRNTIARRIRCGNSC